MNLTGMLEKSTRRLLFLGVALLTGLAAPAAQGAGCYQGKPTVEWIVPFSPGGGFDTYSRLLQPYFAKYAGAEVVIRNVTGAGGINGFRTLYRAKPDGHTVGILFGSGVIVSNLIDKMKITLSDYSLLGRVAPEQPIWVFGKNSPYKDIWDVLKSNKPIVGVATGPGSASYFDQVVSAHLLGVYDRLKTVSGFKGSRQATLSVIRGEEDFGDYNYSSVRDRVNNGDLRPFLLVTEERIAQDNPKMKGVPTIFDVLKKIGREDQIEGAKGLVSTDKVARVIAAPPGINAKLLSCMEDKLYEAMQDKGFKQAAEKGRRPLDPARAQELREPLKRAVAAAKEFAPLYKQAIANMGG
jgi:tripartite-type tricarboxylate transporter receptor subunit TctC